MASSLFFIEINFSLQYRTLNSSELKLYNRIHLLIKRFLFHNILFQRHRTNANEIFLIKFSVIGRFHNVQVQTLPKQRSITMMPIKHLYITLFKCKLYFYKQLSCYFQNLHKLFDNMSLPCSNCNLAFDNTNLKPYHNVILCQ